MGSRSKSQKRRWEIKRAVEIEKEGIFFSKNGDIKRIRKGRGEEARRER